MNTTRTFALGLLMLATAACASQGYKDASIALRNDVATCREVAHAEYEYYGIFMSGVLKQVDRAARRAFEKCMTAHGWRRPVVAR